jgi:Leucine-rich repeat (LRR) protein
VITILTSIKLYMKITENSTAEQELAISFKSLALDIFKVLSLPTEDRGTEGLLYLNKVYNKYVNLVENSAILNQMNKKDQLLVIDPRMLSGGSSVGSNESPLIRTDEDEI